MAETPEKPKKSEGGEEQDVTALLNKLLEMMNGDTDVPEGKKTAAEKLDEIWEKLDKARPEDEKKRAKEFAEEVKKKGSQHVSTSPPGWAENNQYPAYPDTDVARQLVSAKQTLTKALAASKSKPAWLVGSAEEIQHCPQAAEFAARIALLPPDLQHDPNILYREAARLAASLNADLTIEARVEANTMIKKTIAEIGRRSEGGFALTEREMLNSLTDMGMGGVGAPLPKDTHWIFAGAPGGVALPPKIEDEIMQLKKLGGTTDWHKIDQLYVDLGDMSGLSPDQQTYVVQVRKNVLEKFKAMRGGRFQPTLDEIDKLCKSAAERDKAFYERIRKVLENPNEETHKQLNLYDQADLDTLMGIFGQAVAENPDKPGEFISVGDKVSAHYQNLQDSILRLSDLEYWGRNSAGDVENMTKQTNFFENKFAVEAIADPLVEDMMQCVELAIKFIRDNNDNYIPQELMRYDPLTHTTFVDDLALKFFEQRMDAGAVHDYVRDETTGVPVLDPDTRGRTIKRSDKAFRFEEGVDEEDKKLRLLATLRLAKGVGVLTNRTIELCAFTRTPGVDTGKRESGGGPVFSSKAFGGLTRWTNPLSEWFTMYKFGDTLFLPFFNALLDQKGGADGKVDRWSLTQFQEAMDLASGGDNTGLEKKFGKDAKRLGNMFKDFSFSGRMGPLSMWGLKDSTIDWTPEQYERLGASMRLSFAHGWADDHVKEEFKKAMEGRGWNERQMNEAWTKAALGHEGEWATDEWEIKVKNYENAYKTKIWTDFIMRNPQGVASAVYVDNTRPGKEGKTVRVKLRSKIIEDILGEDMEKKLGCSKGFVMERDVASIHTMDQIKRRRMDRIAILDGDVGAVMRYAMNTDGYPRDIRKEDFERCINGNREFVDASGNKQLVLEAVRRTQATEYWNKVQRELLGKALGERGPGWDVIKWRESLGVTGWGDKKPGEVGFRLTLNGTESALEEIYAKAADDGRKTGGGKVENILLTLKEITNPIQVHLGTEDTQWGYLDLNTLGDRHWGRRAGDNLTRAKTVSKMMDYFHALTGKPKMEDLVKLIAEIGVTEKGHDPKEAAKFASLWAAATGDIYRQRKLAGFPIVGRVMPALGIPMSIAQQRMGTESAAFWSVNNMLHFADLIGQTRVIPEKRVMDGLDYGKYTMESLRKNLGASKLYAMLELFIIGYIIALAATSLTAVQSTAKEEEGH